MVAGFEEDFLQTIVAVNWGGPFAALTFQSKWIGGVSNSNDFTITVPQLNQEFFVYEAYSTGKLIQSTKPYHKETKTKLPNVTVTVTQYLVVSGFSNPPDSGSGEDVVDITTDGTNTFWSIDGTSDGGAGGLDDALAFIIAGWGVGGFITSVNEIGSSSHTESGATLITDLDNAVFLFNLNQIKAALGATATSFDVQFSTGTGPASVVGGTVAYDWTTTFSTFKNGSFTSFKVDNTNLPFGWPKPETTESAVSPSGSPVPSEDFDFVVDLTTL